MKDAYSFDRTESGLDASYQRMYNAYVNIFTRCGLQFRAVEADSGAIGGTDTHEFMALADVGEDTIVHCTVLPICGEYWRKQSERILERQNIRASGKHFTSFATCESSYTWQ